MKTSAAFEAFLARLYTDPALLKLFLDGNGAPPARAAGLTNEEIGALAALDRQQLRIAFESLARKRGSGKHGH